MLEGLWIVQYVGLQGSGGGAVVLVNGKVLGGDDLTDLLYQVDC